MFGRKKNDDEDMFKAGVEPVLSEPEEAPPLRPFAAGAGFVDPPPGYAPPPYAAPSGRYTPMPASGPRVESFRRPESAPGYGIAREEGGKKLIVGRDISLSGEISACEKLIVEGTVEANLRDCKSIEITRTGTFKGKADLDEADIGGRFEGSLTVRGKLTIRTNAEVHADVRYGSLEVEPGGVLSGAVHHVVGPAAGDGGQT